MKIAIDVRSLMEERHSGVQEYTTQIITALLKAAPQHTWRLFYNAAKPVQLPVFSGRAEIVPFRFPNKIFNGFQWATRWPRWDGLLEADCFFVPSFRLLPMSGGTPVVTTVHDLSFERFPEFFSWQRRFWHHLMRPRQLMQASQQLIAVSEATARDLRELYHIPAEHITVIHSGVQVLPVTARNSKQRVRQTYHLPEHFILYCGTLEPRKNITSIIQAFSAIADSIPHDLVIAGARGWLTSAIDAEAKKSPHASRIHFPGFIAEADKMSLYAAADLFVYPSFYEGFGFPPLEALLAGTPVVTSYNSSLPEIVGEWVTLVDPYNPNELAAVLKELLSNLPIVSPQTRQAIEAKYSWSKAAEQTLQVIESIVSKNEEIRF